jgi:superfamily II DNA or RNA helicase
MKGSYISKRGYVLRKENVSSELLTELKQELRGRPLQDEKYSFYNYKDTTFPLYIETVNKLYIPKMYAINRFGNPERETLNYIGQSWQDNIAFHGTLYEYQKEPCEKLLTALTTSGGGILSLQTGQGKSICALYVISQLQGKTLIIVNKIALMKQWENEIKTFLPNASVGFIQGQKNVDIMDKDIVIGMLQSLARIDYPERFFDEFKTTVTDECHNVCSKSFSKVLMKVCSKYTIGLSATPNRSDGCEYIFKWFAGDIVYESHVKRKGLPPVVNTIKITSKDYKEISTTNKMTGRKQIMYSSMLSDLIEMEKRNKLITEVIKNYVNTEKRKILVLSDRREHLKCIKRLLDNDVTVTFTYGLFLGQMKITDLERSKASQVILASYQAFGEGVNEKSLDTLFLITPKKFIGHLQNTSKNESGKLEQIVGRIFRKEHVDVYPLIIDLYDNFSVYSSQYKQRLTFYKQHFPVVCFRDYTIKLDNTDINQIDMSCLELKKDETDMTVNYNECLL